MHRHFHLHSLCDGFVFGVLRLLMFVWAELISVNLLSSLILAGEETECCCVGWQARRRVLFRVSAVCVRTAVSMYVNSAVSIVNTVSRSNLEAIDSGSVRSQRRAIRGALTGQSTSYVEFGRWRGRQSAAPPSHPPRRAVL